MKPEILVEQPLQMTQDALMSDPQAFASEFAFPLSDGAQADMAQMNANEQQAELEMLVGFNPQLLALYMRAEQGSSLSRMLSQLLVADLAVNNAVAYGLLTDPRKTEEAYHYYIDSGTEQ